METPSPTPSLSPRIVPRWSSGRNNKPDEDGPLSPSKSRQKKQKHVKVPLKKPKPIRFHRIYHGKTRRWHDNTETEEVKPEPKRSPKLQSPQSLVNQSPLGGADPFNALGLPNDSRTNRALHHWTTVFQNTRMPITPRKNWVKINLSDQTLLSVTTYCSTSHYYFCRGAKPPPSCISQKVLAIRNINNTLQRPNAVISDYVMVGVAVMTLLECLAGSPRECAIHRKGLQLMLHKRGGLRELGFDGGAERTISWADTCCSIFQRTLPTLQPILILDAGESLFSRRFDIGHLRERLISITESEDLLADILYVWLRLRYLAEFFNNVPDHTLDDCFFSDKLDLLERRILALLHSDKLAVCKNVAFLTALCNSGLIFIYEDLRTCPRWTNVCMTLSTRIMSGISMVELTSVIDTVPEMLLWTLLVGRSGIPPIECPSIGWYAAEIEAVARQKRGIQIPPVVSGLKYFELSDELRPELPEIYDVES